MVFKIYSQIIEKIGNYSTVNLKRSQWWDYDELVDFQEKRLKKIIQYAYTLPGYRKKFDACGINPRNVRNLDDLKKIPITKRIELQDNPNFINKNRITYTLYTGGSTGTSLKYYESRYSGYIRWNAHLRGWSWNGYKPGRRIAIIASSQGVIGGENSLDLAGELTEKKLKNNVEELKKFKPQHIRGYVSSIYILARYCLNNDISIQGIESINPISENLYDFQRKTIETAFGCPVFEEYCCNDGGACAWECNQHKGLHDCMERAIIEEVNGKMIVTDLWNLAMPFVRYENGDTVTVLSETCSCGRKLPLISVKGRNNDIIITRKGFLSPSLLMYRGIGYGQREGFRSGIQSVQYVQKPGYVLEINLVKNLWCSDYEIQTFKEEVSKIAEGMEIRINIVQQIPTTPRGKRSFIINEDVTLLKEQGFS